MTFCLLEGVIGQDSSPSSICSNIKIMVFGFGLMLSCVEDNTDLKVRSIVAGTTFATVVWRYCSLIGSVSAPPTVCYIARVLVVMAGSFDLVGTWWPGIKNLVPV